MTRISAGGASPFLAPGDTVAVVAPGFAVRRQALRAGLARLRAMGFDVLVGKHVLARDGYFAGTDAERAEDLNEAARNPAVRAVWFARGGYGTARLLDLLDWKALERSPRLFIGYSDLTALFSRLLARNGSICLYGPVVSEMGDENAYDPHTLAALFRGEAVTLRFGPRQVIRHGRAVGRLAGGNLTVLSHLLGTRHAPDLRGSLLFLEDVGEEVYRLDRTLQQLRMTGALDSVAGVLLGNFDPPKRRHSFPPDRPLMEVFREVFEPLGVPLVRGLPLGHLRGKKTLPLGSLARVDTRTGRLDVPARASRT